jgi:hypothetical protein
MHQQFMTGIISVMKFLVVQNKFCYAKTMHLDFDSAQ